MGRFIRKRDDILEAGHDGRYACQELFNHMDISYRIQRAHELLQASEDRCNEFKAEYDQYEYLFNRNLDETFQKIKQDCGTEVSPGLDYDLERFESEIDKYNKLNNEILEKKSYENLGWLRVKRNKLKTTWGLGSSMGYKFTKHLQDDVFYKLQNLHDFIRTAVLASILLLMVGTRMYNGCYGSHPRRAKAYGTNENNDGTASYNLRITKKV